jgi:hypothetical protein
MKTLILSLAVSFGFALIGQPFASDTDIKPYEPAYKLVGISYEI